MTSNASWVIVTGAGGAIGQALVQRFNRQGFRILALDLSGESLEQLKSTSPEIATSAVDIAADGAFETVFKDHIRSIEPVSLLINCAGAIWSEPLVAVKGASFVAHGRESWDRAILSNLTTTFVASTCVAVHMARRGGGAIVNFSSIAAKGTPGQAAYGAAKAGIEGLTRAMARELGPLGIRVNAVAPGYIDVSSTRAAVASAKLDDYVKQTPLRKLGTLDEVVQVVETLASNTFLTGAVLDLDGGLRL